jgi:hypothetical protein
MSMKKKTIGLGAALALCAANTALAQTGLPTTQPNLLQIYREEVKVGHAAEHEKTEVGWPAAFEKAKSPYYYLAFVSLTGAPEAWFVAPFESHQALGESMKLERGNALLAGELARLQRADAEHLTGMRSIQAIARTELSHGEYPDTAKQRYWGITTFRVRPGHDDEFAAVAKAYGAAIKRSGASTSYRVYQVIAGMPSPTYLVFSSTPSYAAFDKMASDSQAINKSMTEDDKKIFQKFFTEGLISSDTQRFELNPRMSYVSAEVRASDPAFWMPKKPAVK